MKFIYQYRTSDNKQHQAVIRASTKEAAYATLKAQGVKPGKVFEAPGVFNKLFGKGKRWMAIVVLAVVAGASVCAIIRLKEEAQDAAVYAERAQLYGDPVVIGQAMRMGWFNEFKTFGERYLALHAIPGLQCNCGQMLSMRGKLVESLRNVIEAPCVIASDELAEVAQMKRMVNGLKRELKDYLAAGGTVDGYMNRLDIRQKAERGIYERMRYEINHTKDETVRRKKNAELRAMGLPMVESTDEE